MDKVFNTTQSDLVKYNGTKVSVLGPLDDSEYDRFDVGPMFRIMFWDGESTEAFEDELS